MSNLLELKNVRKEYKEFVLDDVSISLPQGYIMGMIGPNGAGKTTTIKIIMNLIRRDGGEVQAFGLTHEKDEKEIKNRIGYVGEEQYYYQNKSVNWTERFVSQFYKNWDTNRFNSLLEDFKISRTKKIRELSRGMKVKLSFAVALSHAPELLILDEPTSGLDPVIRREILDLLQKVCREENKSVLLSSHITDDIARIADYISFIVEGKIVMTAEKDEIISNWKRIHFKKDSVPDQLVSGFKNVEEHMFSSCGITDNFSAIKDQLEKGVAAGDVKVENVGLDDILISYVKG